MQSRVACDGVIIKLVACYEFEYTVYNGFVPPISELTWCIELVSILSHGAEILGNRSVYLLEINCKKHGLRFAKHK